MSTFTFSHPRDEMRRINGNASGDLRAARLFCAEAESSIQRQVAQLQALVDLETLATSLDDIRRPLWAAVHVMVAVEELAEFHERGQLARPFAEGRDRCNAVLQDLLELYDKMRPVIERVHALRPEAGRG